MSDPVLSRLAGVLGDRYTVIREIGAGGMATVYLAEDIKHRRKVALKVLRPELGAVLGPERFLSEINVTANLQHPHLLPLFDSGEADGLLFYVMPYIQGESLRHRLERERQLPVDEAIRIAVACASALDYAHRHDVIHRDLKPENILLHDGQPLVTDFGIALAISNAGGARVTQTGLSLGTPQYMSPEQATGDRVIDARSDIYSLAAVLYEMLVGDPPHLAGTTQAIIAKVLTERAPSVRVYRESVPEHVDAAIQCALAKLPADRFSTAGDFAGALTGARAIALPSSAKSATAAGQPVSWQTRVRSALPWGIAAASLAVVALLAMNRPRTPDPIPVAFPLVLPDSMIDWNINLVTLALSRDGSQLALVVAAGETGGTEIVLHPMGGNEWRAVRGTEGGVGPSFSADGRWLLFTAAGKLKKVPVSGGAATLIADSAAPSSASWSDRNEIVFARGVVVPGPGTAGNRLLRVSANGGPVTLLATATEQDHRFYNHAHMLPGGRAALITIYKSQASSEDGVIGVVSVPEGKVTELGEAGVNPRYLPSGHIVFARADGSLFAAPFSTSKLALTGPAVPVLEQVMVRSTGHTDVAVSDNGTLLYRTAALGRRQLVRVDRQGAARALTDQPRAFDFVHLSADGRRVAVSIANDVWIQDLAAGTITPVTRDRLSNRPTWSPDGQRVVFISQDSSMNRLAWKPWDGSGRTELMLARNGVADVSFGPPNSYMVVRFGYGPIRDLWIAPQDSLNALRPLLETPAMEAGPRVSSNGRLLAYTSNESGRREVYVRPIPGSGQRVQVSTVGGDEAVWSRDGRTLYYRTLTHLLEASIAEQPELGVLSRDTVFTDPFARNDARAGYDVFPDGKSFLMVQNLAREQNLFVVVNWTTELRRRMAGLGAQK